MGKNVNNDVSKDPPIGLMTSARTSLQIEQSRVEL